MRWLCEEVWGKCGGGRASVLVVACACSSLRTALMAQHLPPVDIALGALVVWGTVWAGVEQVRGSMKPVGGYSRLFKFQESVMYLMPPSPTAQARIYVSKASRVIGFGSWSRARSRVLPAL